MLRFLSSLFASVPQPESAHSQALIDAATERAVDGTDRRLRALSDYRQRLREPIEHAVSHVIDLVDALPAPAEISAQTFATDRRMRAFFSSVEHLREILGRSKEIRDYQQNPGASLSDDIFGLLVMQREERTVLGMELDGDTVRKDVVQVAVNFFHHRYIAPTSTEKDTRWELKTRAFDFLIEKALERLVKEKQKRSELERQRCLLQRKLDAMRAGNWGLEAILTEDTQTDVDIAALEAEIESIEAELGQFGITALGLEESLGHIAEVLAQPKAWLDSRQISLRLDYRGIKLSDACPAPPDEPQFTELFSESGEQRIIMLGRAPRREIPERPDVLKELGRYLG